MQVCEGFLRGWRNASAENKASLTTLVASEMSLICGMFQDATDAGCVPHVPPGRGGGGLLAQIVPQLD